MHWVPVVDAGSCKSQKPSTQLAAYSTAETQHPKSQAVHSEQSSLKFLTVAMVLWKPEECDCRFGVLEFYRNTWQPKGNGIAKTRQSLKCRYPRIKPKPQHPTTSETVSSKHDTRQHDTFILRSHSCSRGFRVECWGSRLRV